MAKGKEIAVVEQAPRALGINYDDPKMIAALKATVAQGATDEEFIMFSELCRATGLNPFKREIWFVKTKGYTKRDGTVVPPKFQLMTGINGFYEIANRRPEYDGIETEIVESNGKIVKAVAKAYRKDRSRPSTAEAYYEEYNKGQSNWLSMPRVMLSKCAESMALRKAFPQQLNGLYTEEEMPGEYSRPNDIDGQYSRVEPAKPEPKPEAPANGNGKSANPKKTATRAAMAAGTAWKYRMPDDSIPMDKRGALGATYGIIVDGGFLYAAEEVPELTEFYVQPTGPGSDFESDELPPSMQ